MKQPITQIDNNADSPSPAPGGFARFLDMLNEHARLLAFFFGFVFIVTMILLATAYPNPTNFQYAVFRIVLALAAAGVAGIIPGMIQLKVEPNTKFVIQAGGALAVFVIVYMQAPAALLPNPLEFAPQVAPKPSPAPPLQSQQVQPVVLTTPPVQQPKLLLGNIKIEGNAHVVNFAPDKKVHIARLTNPAQNAVQVLLIGFPEKYFYTNLSHENSLVPAYADRDFSIVFMSELPDTTDFPFELKDSTGRKLSVKITLQGDWLDYFQRQLERYNKKLSRNAGPQQQYDAAKQLLEQDYRQLKPAEQEALTGQFLAQAEQPQAAAIAYFNAEQTAPKIVKRLVMVSMPPVIVALAQIHEADGSYKKAVSWYGIAAKQGDAEAQHNLGGIYRDGKGGIARDKKEARSLFEKAAAQGHERARKELDKLKSLAPGDKPVASRDRPSDAPAIPSDAPNDAPTTPNSESASHDINSDVIKFLRGKGDCLKCNLNNTLIRGVSLESKKVDSALLDQTVIARFPPTSLNEKVRYFLARFKKTTDTSSFLLVETKNTDGYLVVDFSGADLREAKLYKANLRGANLIFADLRGADLSGADLRGANLRGADLSGADLRGADLIFADLRRADLRRADLSEAKLSLTNLKRAKNWRRARNLDQVIR
ncbi:MAG: hypothetical protein GY862_28470 [Gammaproteobacteria bacterium]|nr:hypothetical protein [Gammaproteobacteria bacterium]